MKGWLLQACLLLLVALAGCSSTSPTLRIFPKGLPLVPHTPSTGMVEATVCGSRSFLTLRLTRAPSLASAIEQALEKAGDEFNALADVTATFESTSWILVGSNCVTVRGRPVWVGLKDKPDWMVPATELPAGTAEEDWVF